MLGAARHCVSRTRAEEAKISYLGIDVGGTKVAFRAERDAREPYEATFRWPAPESARADLGELAENVRQLREKWPDPIDAVGVAMPATLDSGGRVVAWPNRPTWAGFDLNSALRALFPEAEICCADDGDLAAIAEANAAQCPNVVYLGVGTGIGGGIVIDGRAIPGPARGSCEIGHLVIDRFGAECDCGRRGCLQAVASGPATLRRAAEIRATQVDFEDLKSAFADGRPWAVSVIQETCAALAVAAVSLSELAHPDMVVVGGGFAAAFPGFVTRVSRAAGALARPGHPAPTIYKATLGGLSSLRGAVLLARQAAETPAQTS
jgi:kanosamine 6-kinase